MRTLNIFLFLLLSGLGSGLFAQSGSDIPVELYEGLEWRLIGPFRGGRSAAVTGVPGHPNLFYMGSTGGGVWRTKDGGQTWENISDGFFGGSIGAVAVSEYDPNVIYVGGGEVTVRGNVSFGNGIWKTTDAGATWTHKGLPNSRHIPRIRIHPKNPDIVYAAVLGDLYQSSEERGVYRSVDGGESWEKVLFSNADAGAVDLLLDPNNPRIIYASTWRIRRTPYSLESGGEGSAIWKSTDSGSTWTDISGNKGMPEGPIGISGIAVSPANSNRVWAQVEAKNGGLFRSEDAGKTWQRINDSRALRQRAWYYTRIYADPQDQDILYIMNVRYHRSKDGGKTFTKYNAPHGDHHDLWIAPEDPDRMIIGDDGGAQISFDGGENWSTYQNQPTSQFYRVTTDNAFPYRIYGAQQDNSAIRIRHRTGRAYIGERAWESTAGGESAHLAVKPDDNDIVVGGSYGGYLTWKNHRTEEERAINVWPDNPLGHGAEGMKYRFQWNFPVFFSPHDPNKLYAASNHLHVSTDLGASWEVISPDLTRNDPAKLVSSGGPITKDNTGVEYYCTIFAAAESPREEGLIWAGSDDGLLHLSKDGGKNWKQVTPPQLPEWSMINSIEIDPHQDGGLYLAATRYKLGDYAPYLFKTSNYGKTWTRINKGIEAPNFTRVIRADPVRKGLLYAGTEFGMYVSFNDGANWQSLQNKLPEVPITDLAVKEGNLIAATQGRSFWMIDDLGPLRQANTWASESKMHLFAPLPSYRTSGRAAKPSKTEGQNHPGGVLVHFYLAGEPDSLTTASLTFRDPAGKEIRTYSTEAKHKADTLELKKGLNRFVWDLRYPGAKEVKGMILWWSNLKGPRAVPGQYSVEMKLNGESMKQGFELKADPRSSSSLGDMQAQFDFLLKCRDLLTATHTQILALRKARKQIQSVLDKTEDDAIQKAGKGLLDPMQEIEEALYQTKNRSPQDPLNFPIRLNNKLGHLAALADRGDFAPTQQMEEFRQEISSEIQGHLDRLAKLLDEDLKDFNALVRDKGVDAVILDSENE